MKKYVMLLMVLIACSLSSQLSAQPAIGQKAPVLSGLKFINNKLPHTGNKFVFIDFWATWCGPCIASLPHVDKLAAKYNDKIVFLAISDEKEMVVQQFLQKNHFSSLIFGLDIQKDLFSGFVVKSIPQYYLISPNNTIIASGLSSEVSDAYLDSLITNYSTAPSAVESKIKITEDSVHKISSIEIFEKPNVGPFLSKSGYTFVVRDSLSTILPYLSGVRLFNRIRTLNLPKKMIEVKIFSRDASLDSLKILVHHQLMSAYGITKKTIVENTTIYNCYLKNTKQLKNRNTYVEPGVKSKRDMVNDSTYRFDNYTFKDMVSFFEAAYFPRLFYAQSPLTDEYDWELSIFNPTTHAWISFDKLKTILKGEYGIDIIETKNKETFTVYTNK